MAYIELDTKKLKSNYKKLDKIFNKKYINWSIVTKLLCGNEEYIKEVIKLGIKQICDSRTSNLELIKKIFPNIETIYIKPPSFDVVEDVIKYADISFNTEYDTIKMLSDEAVKQNKIHKIFIMIEMGELREGVLRSELLNFYGKVFELPNIEVIGIGTNLTCLYGILPNIDKLIQLSLYEQLIECKFKKNIKYISGGSSVTIPMVKNNTLPESINHFRVGETLYFGTSPYDGSQYKDMYNVFSLHTQIIEINEKPLVPDGEMGYNVEGECFHFNDGDLGKKSYRAILDIGLLDIEKQHLILNDKNLEIVGASSDMIVIDIGKDDKEYNVGDFIEFKLDYMGALRILNSKYIEKIII